MRIGIRDTEQLETQLVEARSRIAELESELAQTSTRDALTSDLLSLRAFFGQLELDVQRAQRYGRPLSVAIVDVDGFRAINAEHGYPVGDVVLVEIGRLIAERTRAHDLACRMAGDEFALLLPETDTAAARQAVERILIDMEALEAGPGGVTASIGVAELGAGESAERLMASAGRALEDARRAGGGRVAVYAGGGGAAEPGNGDVVAALASALQERDRYTSDHSETLVDVAGRIAEALALDAREVEQVRTAALLHDIGKVGIPDEILHKRGPLDDREWEMMRQHPVIGERILRAIPGLGTVARIVRHEHERWDGAGYPDGLAGDAIPVGSRIILACDAYHAMTSDRPYRTAMPHADALNELTLHAGSQFDPDVVEALVGYMYGRRQAGQPAL
jgi:diguanylate cyclase (GGDEF)-like protein/putative nucleotidyltransferase with HDIG domain